MTQTLANTIDLDDVVIKNDGSSYTTYGKDYLEFSLHLNGPGSGRLKISGTQDQVKFMLQNFLERVKKT